MKHNKLFLMKYLIAFFISITGFISAEAQIKKGFDWKEYHDMFILCMKNFYAFEAGGLPEPDVFKLTYSSPSMGLDNKWELYTHHSEPIAAISIRGTSANDESWLANFYSAMIPARGTLQLSDSAIFNYSFSNHPQAAIHSGWAISVLSLSEDILYKIDSLYKKGIHQFFITGHSQGGAISTLLTAYLQQLQLQGRLSKNIILKNYASASPKPGNEYFSHDFKLKNETYGAFNVVNVDDWVPQTFLTVQRVEDYPEINIFKSFENSIDNASLLKRVFMNSLYKKLKKPLNKSQKQYQKYFGKYIYKEVKKHLPQLIMPEYFPSAYYTAAAHVIPMQGNEEYYKKHPVAEAGLMNFHNTQAYYDLILKKLNTP